jgi:selenocysteine lyase/cysteine desulfurase
MPIDVKSLGVDFITFSGHKAVGPTGVGVLWSSLLNELPPFLFGGSMIETVTMTSATWAPAPRKFEAVGQIHPHDLGQYLDSQGVAVRTGHHCAWPLTRKLGVPATTRASLYLYNDESDCDALFAAILGAQKYFA